MVLLAVAPHLESRVSWWRDLVQVKGIQSIGRKRLWHGFLLWTETLEAASKQEQRRAKFYKCKELPGQVQGCCNRCLGGFPAEAPARKRWEQKGLFSTSSCPGIVSKRQNQAELRKLLLLVEAAFQRYWPLGSLRWSYLYCPARTVRIQRDRFPYFAIEKSHCKPQRRYYNKLHESALPFP